MNLFLTAEGALRAPWRLLLWALACVLGYAGAQAILYPLGASALQSFGVRGVLWPWLQVAGVLLGTLIAFHWFDQGRVGWKDVGLGEASLRARPLLGGFAGGALAIAIPVLVLSAFGWLRIEAAPAGSSFEVVWRTALVLAPYALYEEVLVRGYALTVIREAAGWRLALLATSVFFAVMHLWNPGATALSFAIVLLAGLWLGAIRLVTGSLYAAWAAHFAWNWVMAAGLHVPVSGIRFPVADYRLVDAGPDWATGGTWGPEGGLLAACGMWGATVWYLTRPEGRLLLRRPRGAEHLTSAARPAGREER